ncbi:hypothetical protein [Actinoallomurus sp. CA-150999]|uniref:hypothetical protein n=1 Tax=Actinoallomurus sp. CA-150999 TaxID=3239887 RepID=UPI003D8B6E7A
MKALIHSVMVTGGLVATLTPGVSAQAQTSPAPTATSSTVYAKAGCRDHKSKLTLPKEKPKGVNVWGYIHSFYNEYGISCKTSYIWLKVTDTANDSKKAYVKIKARSCDNGCHTFYDEKRAPGGKGKSATITYYPVGYIGWFKGCVDNDSWGTKSKCTKYKVMYNYH